MIERLSELQGRIERSRTALETLAERASALRTRLEAEPSAAAPSAARVSDDKFVRSLDQLNQAAGNGTVMVNLDATEGADGDLLADAWEIALINEEGK